MIKLNQKDFNNLIKDSKILLADYSGPKVLKLASGHCLKFFRVKKWLSSAMLYNYADRFADNAEKLTQLGINTVQIINRYKIPSGYIKYSKLTKAIEYTYLEGDSLRDLILNNNFSNQEAQYFGEFISNLHNLGIYFRANHFGNIIYNPNLNQDFKDQFGLIDIENTKFYNKPLNKHKRKRNFAQMIRYKSDKDWLESYKKEFTIGYFKNSNNCSEFAII